MLCVFSVYLFAKLFEHPSYMTVVVRSTITGPQTKLDKHDTSPSHLILTLSQPVLL